MPRYVLAVDPEHPTNVQFMDRRLWDSSIPLAELAQRGVHPEIIHEVDAADVDEGKQLVMRWYTEQQMKKGVLPLFHETVAGSYDEDDLKRRPVS